MARCFVAALLVACALALADEKAPVVAPFSTPTPGVELVSASFEPATPVLIGQTLFFTDSGGRNVEKRCAGQDLWSVSVAEGADRLPRKVAKIPCVETLFPVAPLDGEKGDVIAVVTVNKDQVRIARYNGAAKLEGTLLKDVFETEDALWPARAQYARQELNFRDEATMKVSVRSDGASLWLLLELAEKERSVVVVDAVSLGSGEPLFDVPMASNVPTLPVDWSALGKQKLALAFDGNSGADSSGSIVTLTLDPKKARVVRSDRAGALDAPSPDWTSLEVGQYFVRNPRFLTGASGRWYVYDATTLSFESKAVATSLGTDTVNRVPVGAVGIRDVGGLGFAQGGLLVVDRGSRSVVYLGEKNPFPSDLTTRTPRKAPKDAKEKK